MQHSNTLVSVSYTST